MANNNHSVITRIRAMLNVIAAIPAGYARLGRGDQSGVVVANPAQRRVYYFDGPTNQPTATAKLAQEISISAINNPSLEGTRVRLGYPPYDPKVLYVIGFDSGEGMEAVGGATPGEQLENKTLYPDVGSIQNLRIMPQETPDTTVFVNPSPYYDADGKWQVFGGDTDDWATEIAALSSGKHQMGIVCLDRTTGDLVHVTSAEMDGGVNDKDSFDWTTIFDLDLSADYIPAGTVHLYFGQVEIREDDIYRTSDPRVVFGKPSGGSGSALAVSDGTTTVDPTTLLDFDPTYFDVSDMGGGQAGVTLTTDPAPSDAHYVTTQAESGLSQEFNLGALTDGILKHTVSAGVSTPATAVAGTDYTSPSGTENLSNKTFTDQVLIDGSADEIQLLVQGNGTQTALLAVFENSGGTDQVTISNTGSVVINEAGNDADTRIEGDTDANLIYTDASVDRVGIGKNNPGEKLDVTGSIGLSTYQDFAETSTPSTPASDHARAWVADDNGFTIQQWMNSGGIVFSNGRDTFVIAKNTSGSTLFSFAPVYFTGTGGTDGGIIGGKAQANNIATLAHGFVRGTIANNAYGIVQTGGRMLNMTAAAGQGINYLDAAAPGTYAGAAPTGTGEFVQILGFETDSIVSGEFTISLMVVPVGMAGATSGAAGASGAVPQPAAGDQDKFLRGDGTWGTSKFAVIEEQQAQNTAGGGSTATTWTTRVLNTEVVDANSIVTISSNKFTPIAGTYRIFVSSPVVGSGSSNGSGRLRLRNVTATSVVFVSANHSLLINQGCNMTFLTEFTANGTDEYDIQYYVSQSRATNGLGLAVNEASAVERYTQVTLEKIA